MCPPEIGGLGDLAADLHKSQYKRLGVCYRKDMKVYIKFQRDGGQFILWDGLHFG
tara:strand:+ start:3401 stop:3565 length:165 start_codon:yes stop_codon:yes gene_type:complete